jgi:hypothetical protein
MAQRTLSDDATFYSASEAFYNQSARRERSRDMIDDAKRHADSLGTAVNVEIGPGDKVHGRRKPDSKTIRQAGNQEAGTNDQQIPVESKRPMVIKSRGGKVMGKANSRPAPQMSFQNANQHYLSQRSRELDALVAERARNL